MLAALKTDYDSQMQAQAKTFDQETQEATLRHQAEIEALEEELAVAKKKAGEELDQARAEQSDSVSQAKEELNRQVAELTSEWESKVN